MNTLAYSLRVSGEAPIVRRWALLRTREGLGVAELKKRKKTRHARKAGGVMEAVKCWLLTRVLNRWKATSGEKYTPPLPPSAPAATPITPCVNHTRAVVRSSWLTAPPTSSSHRDSAWGSVSWRGEWEST